MGDYGFEGAGDFGGQDYFGEPEEILKATDAKMTQEYLKFLNDHQVTIVTKTALPNKPKKRRNNKIQVGDQVLIKDPLFFVRCGYDNNLQDEIAKIYQNEYELVREFSKKMGNIRGSALEQIIRQVAYDRVGKHKHDGAERKIYTHMLEKYRGWKAEVYSVSFVKTGKYSSSSGHYTYDGEYDYEPAGLYQEKTHRILELNVGDSIIRSAYKTPKMSISVLGDLIELDDVQGQEELQLLNSIEDVHCELVL